MVAGSGSSNTGGGRSVPTVTVRPWRARVSLRLGPARWRTGAKSDLARHIAVWVANPATGASNPAVSCDDGAGEYFGTRRKVGTLPASGSRQDLPVGVAEAKSNVPEGRLSPTNL